MAESGPGALMLSVVNSPSVVKALSNNVWVSPLDLSDLVSAAPASPLPSKLHVLIGDFVYILATGGGIQPGAIGLGGIQRRDLGVTIGASVRVSPYTPQDDKFYLATVKLGLDYLNQYHLQLEAYDVGALERQIRERFSGQFLSVNQKVVLSGGEQNLVAHVWVVRVRSGVEEEVGATRGLMHENTVILLDCTPGSTIKLSGNADHAVALLHTL
jgi:hypothetical protein